MRGRGIIVQFLVGVIGSGSVLLFIWLFNPAGVIPSYIKENIWSYQDISILLLGLLLFLLSLMVFIVLYIALVQFSELNETLKKGFGLIPKEEASSRAVVSVYPNCRWLTLVDIREEPCNCIFYLSCEHDLMSIEGCLRNCYMYSDPPKSTTGSGALIGGIGGALVGIPLGVIGVGIVAIIGALIGNAWEYQSAPLPSTDFRRRLNECKGRGCGFRFIVSTS